MRCPRTPLSGRPFAILLALGLGLSVAGGSGSSALHAAQAAGERSLPAVLFTAADGTTAALAVEVADEGDERTCGLMYRTEMSADQGMLFVFISDFYGGFWNKNTFIALSVAYIAADGTIVDIADMEPIRPDETPTIQQPHTRPVRYVIEANWGWYAAHGIGIGDHADVSAALVEPDAAAPPPVSPC